LGNSVPGGKCGFINVICPPVPHIVPLAGNCILRVYQPLDGLLVRCLAESIAGLVLHCIPDILIVGGILGAVDKHVQEDIVEGLVVVILWRRNSLIWLFRH